MSDYKRTRDALSQALPAGDTGDPLTFEYALDQLTDAVLSLLADETWHWAQQFLQPPVHSTWPLEEAGLTPRESYLRGWAAASDVLRARTAALRAAEPSDDDPEPSVEELREILKGVSDTPS
jgi:hypothetical protein